MNSTLTRIINNKYTPAVLIGTGVACYAFCTGASVRAALNTNPALQGILRAHEEGELNNKEAAREITKHVAPSYIPAAVAFVAGTACVIGAHKLDVRHASALAALCTASEATINEYKKQIKETLGEEKGQEVIDKVIDERAKTTPIHGSEVPATPQGNELMYDSVSGRYFRASRNYVEKMQNAFNADVVKDGCFRALNDFYYVLGIGEIGFGNDIGFTAEHLLDIHFSPTSTVDGELAWAMEYDYFHEKEAYTW